MLVKDINPGASSSLPASPIVVNGRLVFQASDGVHGAELWATDGTAAGTQILCDITAGAGSTAISKQVVDDGRTYFVVTAAGSSIAGVWETDGTPAGTAQVSSGTVSFLAAWGDQIVYSLPSSRGWDNDLYVINATGGTPTHLTNASFASLSSSISTPTQILIGADDGTSGNEIWHIDSANISAGPSLLADLGTVARTGTPAAPVVAGNNLFYSSSGTGLYSTNLQTGVVSKLVSATVTQTVAAGNLLYFTVGDASNAPALWVTDGTRAGTSLIAQMPNSFAVGGGISALSAAVSTSAMGQLPAPITSTAF